MLQRSIGSPDQFDTPPGNVDLWRYVDVVRHRFFYFFLPFVAVLIAGSTAVMLWPPTYRAEGKILVESQQVPTDLVRPTVTGTASERIQVIEQRVTNRENLIGVVNKFDLYAEKRKSGLSGTELLDLVRAKISIKPFELENTRRRSDNATIALTVGFEDNQPDLAMRVANELLTLILAEDARNRTSRALETTKFLGREVKRLEGEMAAVDAQIREAQKKGDPTGIPEKIAVSITALKAELAEKSPIYSETHPEIVRIKRQLAALNQVIPKPAENHVDIDALQSQRAQLEKNLEKASEKLTTARLGESLERDQFSERLEVLEQAIVPQKPIKPNRPKMLGLVAALALGAGIGLVGLTEMVSPTVRGRSDLFRIADPSIVFSIPYITTRREVRRKWRNGIFAALLSIGTLIAALFFVNFWVRPLDLVWTAFVNRFIP